VHVVKVQTEMVNSELRTPTKIPEKVKIVQEEEAPPTTAGVMGGVSRWSSRRFDGWCNRRHYRAPALRPCRSCRLENARVVGCQCGLLIHKVGTELSAASQDGPRGRVRLCWHANQSVNGPIEGLTLMSGPGDAGPAAIDAVKQWRYQAVIC